MLLAAIAGSQADAFEEVPARRVVGQLVVHPRCLVEVRHVCFCIVFVHCRIGQVGVWLRLLRSRGVVEHRLQTHPAVHHFRGQREGIIGFVVAAVLHGDGPRGRCQESRIVRAVGHVLCQQTLAHESGSRLHHHLVALAVGALQGGAGDLRAVAGPDGAIAVAARRHWHFVLSRHFENHVNNLAAVAPYLVARAIRAVVAAGIQAAPVHFQSHPVAAALQVAGYGEGGHRLIRVAHTCACAVIEGARAAAGVVSGVGRIAHQLAAFAQCVAVALQHVCKRSVAVVVHVSISMHVATRPADGGRVRLSCHDAEHRTGRGVEVERLHHRRRAIRLRIALRAAALRQRHALQVAAVADASALRVLGEVRVVVGRLVRIGLLRLLGFVAALVGIHRRGHAAALRTARVHCNLIHVGHEVLRQRVRRCAVWHYDNAMYLHILVRLHLRHDVGPGVRADAHRFAPELFHVRRLVPRVRGAASQSNELHLRSPRHPHQCVHVLARAANADRRVQVHPCAERVAAEARALNAQDVARAVHARGSI